MKRSVNRLSGLLLCAVSLQAAGDEALNRYLAGAQEMLAFPSATVSGEAAWLDRPEVRYDGNDQDEHGLAFRFSPRSGAERRAEDRIYALLNRHFEVALEAQLNDELYRRYLRLIDLLEAAAEVEAAERRTALSQDRMRLNRKLVQSKDFRVTDLQAAELAHQRDRQQLEMMRARLQDLLASFDGISPGQLQTFLARSAQRLVQWENFLVAGSELLERAQNYELQSDGERVEFQLAQERLKLVRGEARRWFGFVEVKWVDRPDGDRETSLGFSIPLGRDRLDLAQRAAALNRAGLSLQTSRADQARRLLRYVEALDWQQREENLQKAALTRLEQQLARLGGSGQAEILLELQAEILTLRERLQRDRLRRLREYIDLLHEVGYLASQPLVNWLLHDQPGL